MTIIPAPEFSVTVPLSEIGSTIVSRQLAANATERAALAKRFDLLALDMLEADVRYHREGEAIVLDGQLRAEAQQACIATGEPVAARVQEPLNIRFVAELGHEPDAEIELAADDCDTLTHDGRVIDLGEAVAQSLALALDPFPRSPNADAVLKAAGVKDESEAGPFGALAALKEKLEKK
ncbi:DUF177 domain-containing protein [Sphingorhabdus pulchriflava]|uniref:DUF177 domain-containing protein n=1 Tax=Sphingorhabdus pulchriflava TaxID=2292257 RepID=A0A371B502_9SPHN|nr:DUF177 domain-containing protein [Sphingorhabdus pulchriflava]RDV02582.1 DUF177 domain-containing protein [Sphingorhabdus pulchriflava]